MAYVVNRGMRGSIDAPSASPLPAARRMHETANPRDGCRPECWCPPGTTAAIPVCQLADAVPRSVAQRSLKPSALEAGAAQLERRGVLGLGDDAMKPALHQGPQSDTFARR